MAYQLELETRKGHIKKILWFGQNILKVLHCVSTYTSCEEDALQI